MQASYRVRSVRPYEAYSLTVTPFALSLPLSVTLNGIVRSSPGRPSSMSATGSMARSGPAPTVSVVSKLSCGAVSVPSGPPVAVAS
ncbi:hypothetical protein CTZ28_44410 [Streptomyces shenzhenensis]|uniref:Uncharacterized protein n=1 Tax=Streptomyces shenzhenensis TaxID=943815 RepID=A0A3M0HU93_9ACTN|nr:hypothetical protein CTZ28_44410 [Streptomyces shenzhenensis]